MSCFDVKFGFVVSQAEIYAQRVQTVGLECWDWDPGFPGYQNDDLLGRYIRECIFIYTRDLTLLGFLLKII